MDQRSGSASPAASDAGTSDHDDASDAFVTASRALIGIAVRSLDAAPVEVTVTQHRVLVVLAARGDQTVGEIAEALGVHPSNATRYTDRLQRLGLVRRSRSDHDGRVVRVALTPAGHDLLQAVTAKRREDVLEVLGRMTSRETTEAVRALQAFSRAAGEAEERDWAVAPW